MDPKTKIELKNRHVALELTLKAMEQKVIPATNKESAASISASYADEIGKFYNSLLKAIN